MCVSFFELFYLHCPPAAALALELPFPVWAALGYVCNVCPSGFAVPGESWAQSTGHWSLVGLMFLPKCISIRHISHASMASHVRRACMHWTMHSPVHRGITRCQPSLVASPILVPVPLPGHGLCVMCSAMHFYLIKQENSR